MRPDRRPANAGIVVRTAVEPASIVPAVRQAIWSLDKNQPIARIRTMEEIVDRELSTPSQSTTLLGAFALLALLLASLGMYGVLSHAVTQRTNEIGVRMALGATSGEILLSFGGRGLALTLAGLAVGLVLARSRQRVDDRAPLRLSSRLHAGGRRGVDGAAGGGRAGVFLPARRASRIDPVVALQHE